MTEIKFFHQKSLFFATNDFAPDKAAEKRKMLPLSAFALQQTGTAGDVIGNIDKLPDYLPSSRERFAAARTASITSPENAPLFNTSNALIVVPPGLVT